MNNKRVTKHIVEWLKDRIAKSGQKGFVVGISGGIDSAVTSSLCAMTKLPLICLSIPIHQINDQNVLSMDQIKWLKNNYKDVKSYTIDLTVSFDTLIKTLPNGKITELAKANSRSRLRMITLYLFANSNNYLVAGTGNKIEDYGIGFFTKFGDGGVDISPIADLTKSEVFELAKHLGLLESIQKAAPTDGLWEDNRTDEDQIGATYKELEWALEYCDKNYITKINYSAFSNLLGKRENEVLKIYLTRHIANAHKILPPPVCPLETIKN